MSTPSLQTSVILKKGKEKVLLQRHHWLFSGAIASFPVHYNDGDIVPVMSHQGLLLGHGYFNRKQSLAGRMVSFGDIEPFTAITTYLKQAISLRKSFFTDPSTTAFRLVNGEGDALPGLIVDKYGDYLCLQIATKGLEKMKPFIVDQLIALIKPKGIYEKSKGPSRDQEGLPPFEGVLSGDIPDEIEIAENGCLFKVSLKKGQKTGFFLDQREMRALVKKYAKGKTVLNCFAYTGGFSVYALQGGALKVDTVEVSEEALSQAKKNVALNGFKTETQGFFKADVFEFLKEKDLPYDLIILDPPAFAKKKGDIESASKGYKEINFQALKKMKPGSLLLTNSCSYHMDETLFQMLIFQAALLAKREVRILCRQFQAFDHPINLFHRETEYLKSLLLYVF